MIEMQNNPNFDDNGNARVPSDVLTGYDLAKDILLIIELFACEGPAAQVHKIKEHLRELQLTI